MPVVTNKEAIQALQALAAKQQATISELSQRVFNLESSILRLEGTNIVANRVSTLMRERIDDLEQYGRRSCLVVDGIPLPNRGENENVIKKVTETLSSSFANTDIRINDSIDKAHRIGGINNKNQQSVIIKFKTHSARSSLYGLRKQSINKNIKLKVSLTKMRKDLIAEANGIIENEEKLSFAFADPNGNIRILLKEKHRNKKTMGINSIDDLHHLIAMLDDGIVVKDLYPLPLLVNEPVLASS